MRLLLLLGSESCLSLEREKESVCFGDATEYRSDDGQLSIPLVGVTAPC